MASLYELPGHLNHLKQELTHGKSIDYQIKLEKLSHFESFNFSNTKCTDSTKHLENLHKSQFEKSKNRLFPHSRTENLNIVESRSPSFKSLHESSLPITTKVPFLPLLSIRTNAIEELYKSIKELKSNITELEEKSRVSSQCIELNKLKIVNLEDTYERLKKKAGLGLPYEEKKTDLQNKLKVAQEEWKKSSANLTKMVQELELEARSLTKKVESSKELVLKQGINSRALQRSIKNCSNTENNTKSCDSFTSVSKSKVVVHNNILDLESIKIN